MAADDTLNLNTLLMKQLDKIDSRMDRMADELVETRHTLKGSIDQVMQQTLMHDGMVRQHDKQLAKLEEWRVEGGTLDQRFKRHSDRINSLEADRDERKGSWKVIATIGVTVGAGAELLASVLKSLIAHHS